MDVKRCPHCMADLLGHSGSVCPFCGFDAARHPQPPEALPRDTVLYGKYLVGDVLGRGGFGMTYVGFDLSLESKVAIKEYYPSGAAMRREGESALSWSTTCRMQGGSETAKNSFLKEARKMARVENIPSVVRVRETFLENETAYIVMDYIEGETLKARLKRDGPMTYSDCFALLRPMMRDLCLIHRQGIIHRDISPDNIMIQWDGSVKLLDLGAAKDLNLHSDEVTMPVGKNGYSPMEQYLTNGIIGPWTDVYALCATIYYACYGVRVPQSLERLEQDTLRFDLPTREPMPYYVVEALKKGLAVRAIDRTQSVDDLLEQLEDQTMPLRQPEPAKARPAAKPAPAEHNAAPAAKLVSSKRYTKPANKGKGAAIGVTAAAAVVLVVVAGVVLTASKPGRLPTAAVEQPASASVEASASTEGPASASVPPESTSASEESSAPASSEAPTKTAPSVTEEENAISESFSSSVASSKAASSAPTVQKVTNYEIPVFSGSTGSYTGQLKDGKPSGHGKVTITSETFKGDTYEGDWLNGKMNGQGRYTWADGSYYEGDVVDNLCSGYGKKVSKNGNVYEGQWKNSLPDGQGMSTDADGRVYVGQWVDGQRSGQGTMTWPNGNVYEGQWENDKINGQGTMNYADFGVYVGQWKDGRWSGQGTMNYADGDSREGEFLDGFLNGYGKLVMDGNTYEGQFANGAFNGQGTLAYKNGDVYIGQWVYSLRNGQGTMTYADGTVKSGTWKDDEFVG